MRLVDSAGVAAILTAYLYSVSTAFRHGYFNALGLDSDLLDRNFHQIIYSGLVQSLTDFILLATAVFIFVMVYTTWRVYLSYYIRRGFLFGRRFVRLKKILRISTKKPTKLEAKYQRHFYFSLIALVLTFIFFIVLVMHERKGARRAESVVDAISKGDVTILNSGNYGNDLVFLYCGIRNCAGYDMKEDKLIYVSQQQLSMKSEKYHEIFNNK